MRSHRSSLLALGGTALVSGLLALATVTFSPATADACPGKDGAPCACGAACPEQHAGKCAEGADCAAKAAGGECAGKAAGGCAGKDAKDAGCVCPPGEGGKCACGAECGGKNGGDCQAAAGGTQKKCGCGGAAADPAKAVPAGQEGAANQRAVIDPETGLLKEPGKEPVAVPSAPAAALSAESPAADAPRIVEVPGGGVSAPFPKDRASHAVAKVNEAGETHTGCEHGAE